ncbi:Transmembrane and coiled-coil domain-containing protein 4 [Terramyces sp. JEL0728]|nr:Transmembrane and coiled-coil domain-containing protein 4 [Terramyces sp. JEL0728]
MLFDDSNYIHKDIQFAIAVLFAIQLQTKLIQLQPSNRSYSQFKQFQKSNLHRLEALFSFDDEQMEWMEEMIIPDSSALQLLEQRMIQKLQLEDKTRIHDAELIAANLLYICINCTDNKLWEYDSRLKAALKRMLDRLLDSQEREVKVQIKETARLESQDSNSTLIEEPSVNSRKVSSPFLLFLAESEVIKKMAGVKSELGDVDSNKTEESDNKKLSRWAGVGLAAVGGGLLIGVTGGLATPLIAAGLGTLGTSLGVAGAAASFTALGSVTGAAIVGTLFGVSGAGLAGYKLNRRLKDLEEFYFTPINEVAPGLAYYIAISGWLTDINDSTNQWTHLSDWNPMVEIMTLSFDRQCLVDLSHAVTEYVKQILIDNGIQGVAALTAASTLAFALGWPIAMFQVAAMLDNPWNMALDKAEQAGIHLARSVLAAHVGGKRPVTLIGHGMGARVIVYCLLELYKMTDIDCDIYSMIDSVYLFGAAASLGADQWTNIREIVAGRFVNCYSTNDWFLKLLYRLSTNPAAGFAPIDVPTVENVDASELIQTHGEYTQKLDEILNLVQFEK